jgi:hypothetical protein
VAADDLSIVIDRRRPTYDWPGTASADVDERTVRAVGLIRLPQKRAAHFLNDAGNLARRIDAKRARLLIGFERAT